MCWRELDCTTFVQRASEIEYRDGHFYVALSLSERSTIRLVFPPAVFLQSLLGAEQAMAEWQAEQVGAASNVAHIYPVKALSA